LVQAGNRIDAPAAMDPAVFELDDGAVIALT